MDWDNDDFFHGAYDFNRDGVTDFWEREVAWDMMERERQYVEEQINRRYRDESEYDLFKEDDDGDYDYYSVGSYAPSASRQNTAPLPVGQSAGRSKEELDAMLLAQIPEKVSREYFIRATNVNLGFSAGVLLISAVFCFLPAFFIWECVNDMPTAAQDSRDASVFLIGFNVILLLILLVLTVMALGSVWKHYGIILARRKRTKEEQKRQERSQNE